MDLSKLIEEINSLTEDEFVDDFEDIEAVDNVVEPEPALEQEQNLTNTLDAKTKISRALDVLKSAIEDFKNATAEEIDLVADADLTVCFESLDEITENMAQILTGNDLPKEEPELEPVNDEEPLEQEEEAEGEAEGEEANFDDEAELDLFDVE